MIKLEDIKSKLSNACKYSELYDNELYQLWKKDVVEKRLEAYKQASLSTDPDTDEHKRNLIRYQELEYITEGIFRVWKSQEDSLRKRLKEMS